MPAEIYGERYRFLSRTEILSFEEITRLAKLFVGLGVSKLRITGGEPLVRSNVVALVGMLADIAGTEDLALTTNGYLLAPLAADLKAAGLHRVTVSLDSIDPEVYKRMNGDKYGPEKALEGIDAAIQVGLTPVKINVVVQRGVNDHTLQETADYFRGTGCVVRFIEFMDVGTQNRWNISQVVTAKEIYETINAAFPLKAIDPNYKGEVAKRFVYADGKGEIGIISSISQPFCGDCTRGRLSTSGQLVTCLFASTGRDMKGPMRNGASDEELQKIIAGVWQGRIDRYSELRGAETAGKKIEMYRLGG